MRIQTIDKGCIQELKLIGVLPVIVILFPPLPHQFDGVFAFRRIPRFQTQTVFVKTQVNVPTRQLIPTVKMPSKCYTASRNRFVWAANTSFIRSIRFFSVSISSLHVESFRGATDESARGEVTLTGEKGWILLRSVSSCCFNASSFFSFSSEYGFSRRWRMRVSQNENPPFCKLSSTFCLKERSSSSSFIALSYFF